MRTVHLPGDGQHAKTPELSPMARTYRDMARKTARSAACEAEHCVLPAPHQGMHRTLHDVLENNRDLARLEDQWGKWWARLHKENDALWRRLNEVERQAAEAGVRLNDEPLVAHGAELQALQLATEMGRDSLDQFRTTMVTAMFDIPEWRKAGRTDTDILNGLIKLIDRANDKADGLGDTQKARDIVAQRRAEWQRVVTERDWALFEAAS